MSTNLYLVFSKRPEAVSASDYDRWYETHAQENIESPGFLNARRFELGQVNGTPAPYEHLAVYEYEGAMEQWRAGLNERIKSGDIVLPSGSHRSSSVAGIASRCSGLLQPARLTH